MSRGQVSAGCPAQRCSWGLDLLPPVPGQNWAVTWAGGRQAGIIRSGRNELKEALNCSNAEQVESKGQSRGGNGVGHRGKA